MLTDKEMTQHVNSLNKQQREIFNVIFDWSRKNVKFRNSKEQIKVDSLRLFITGGASVGKSRLMKTISTFLTKTFSYYSSAPAKLTYYY